MGPKSAPAKKAAESSADDPQKQIAMLNKTIQSLQILLAERYEEGSKAMASKREYQGRVEQLSRDFEEEKKQTFEITQDMTRQFYAMKEDLISKNNKLEQTIQELRDSIASSENKHIQELKKKNEVIQMKDEENARLRKEMDDMAEEFGLMLRETYERMREKIHISGGNYESDLHITQKMEEIKNND